MRAQHNRFGDVIILLISCLIVLSFTTTRLWAGYGFIEGPGSQNFLTTPGDGSNIVATMIGEYLGDSQARFHIFVSRCQCSKRRAYTDTGAFITYTQTLTANEFNAITPDVLLGTPDLDGQLTRELAGAPDLLAVISRIIEYKKPDSKRFVARISIKFVPFAMTP